MLDRAPNLKLIAHAAGSVRELVVPAVFEAGIAVTNAALANALPVAEYTLAMILLANKRVPSVRDLYRQRRSAWWRDPHIASEIGNYRKFVGIVGASRVGRRLMELLVPFDLDVLYFDPFVTAVDAASLNGTQVPLDDLLRRSDVVSLHLPLLPETRRMIDARCLALMRDGAILINTARGAVVDQGALVSELAAGRLSAVLDVTDPEPLDEDSPLFDLPNVVLTPHIAGSLGLEQQRLGQMVVEEVRRFTAGEPLAYALNTSDLERQA